MKVKLLEACNISTGKLDSNAAEINGKYPFFTCAPEPMQINSYAFDEDAILLAGNNAQGNFHIQRYNGKFNAYQRTYIITTKEGWDIDFVKYSIEIALSHLKKISQGSQTKFLTMGMLEDFVLNNYPFERQKAIIASLKKIDEKIELNTKINDNLQQVIKSCFDFMFATRKPNGIISDILQEHPKSTIQVNDSTGILGDYPFFTSGEAINEWQSALVDGMNCYLSTGGNATIKGYYGKAAYSTDTWCVCGKGEYSFYLFCYLKSIIRSVNDSFFAGSGLKHLQKDSLLLVNLYIPSEKELEKFNSIVKPAMETMTKLFLETKKLKQQRDFLLPLLMNGQATIAE